jgi:rare lipoprotein A
VQEFQSQVKFSDSQAIPANLIVRSTEGNYFGTQPRIDQPLYPSNVLMVSALATVLSAGCLHQRRDLREKLLSASHPPKRHAEHSAERRRPFEGSGIASVYSDQHTASGEHMNSGAMTAAHRTLPFGTKVTVVNHRNGRSAVVRINDRGPFVRGRVIDLSPAAARALGVDGLASVSLTTKTKAHRPGWSETPRTL